MTTALLSGNEAIARGAWEAGCTGGFGYPGTPSTETLEYFVTLPDVYAEWAPNEKVALETAIGYSRAGRRALVTMKHVGLNVAADPLMTLAYTGVVGGLVILVADDPGMHSSQNEQDTRNYARFAQIPLFEPSDSAEALAMAKEAFEISERFCTPVIIRSTTRISHTKSAVETAERQDFEPITYEKNPGQWVMMPAMAKSQRHVVEQRTKDLSDYVESSEHNRIEWGEKTRGFITSSTVYQYVRDAYPDASVLKLGLSYPLPKRLIAEFFSAVDEVYIAEECSPFLDTLIRAAGHVPAEYPNALPYCGELSVRALRQAFGDPVQDYLPAPEGLPGRPPSLCAGCPHRLALYELRRRRAIVSGDIGCYTLGALAPLNAMDICIDMGASISMAHGMELAFRGREQKRPVIAVIGDSTFTHSGMNSLLNTVYNAGSGNVLILDNRITAMTGAQGNPVNGITLGGSHTNELELVPFLRGLGVKNVEEVDAQSLTDVKRGIDGMLAKPDELSVLICKSPCTLAYRIKDTVRVVDPEKCTACGVCISLGCPAISKDPDGKSFIHASQCVGCGQCDQVCRFGAISPVSTVESAGE